MSRCRGCGQKHFTREDQFQCAGFLRAPIVKKTPKTCRAKFLCARLGRRVRCELPVGHSYGTHVAKDVQGGLIEWGTR